MTGKDRAEAQLPPLVFNVFKPARMGSFDVVRHFKRNLPRGSFGKIGHFGTLDPFACGVFLVGIGGATRLNELVHADLPKTYLAVGKLGVETDTGDPEGKVTQTDGGAYLSSTIARFDRDFILKLLRDRFLGEYWQAPHKFSAAKFQGRPLHAWAREGVDIPKEKVARQVLAVDVVRWSFPYLSVRVTVSSGTYVRTLFSEMAQALGTIGHLVALQREAIGHMRWQDALMPARWGEAVASAIPPEKVLPYPELVLPESQVTRFLNGMAWNAVEGAPERAWVKGPGGELLGLARSEAGRWLVEINFAAARLSAL